MATPAVRLALGIEIEKGVVYSNFPASEVIKGLGRIVRELRAGMNVKKVFYLDDRLSYIQGFEPDSLPAQGNRLPVRVALSDLVDDRGGFDVSASGREPERNTGSPDADTADTGSSSASGGIPQGDWPGNSTSGDSSSASSGEGPEEKPERRSRSKAKPPRTTLIPRSCVLWISNGRINDMYHELMNLDVNQFPNSGAVALRVFVELSVDDYMTKRSLLTEQQIISDPLAKKLRDLADFLHGAGEIDIQLKRVVHKIADGHSRVNASTVTFNQYVHNPLAYPAPSELRVAWDELEPFMQILWKR